jgi:phytoene dehydrogenase-like protein
LERYRYGAAAFKIDWALGGPIPWTAAECAQAATVHLGGTLSEIERSEWQVSRGETPEQPFVLLSQPSLFDSSRAPSGKHVAWGYCHVPNGSTREMTECIEMQIERFAPGFRQHILARHVMSPASIEKRNPNFVGGDIGSGAVDWRQFFARPTAKLYSTSAAGVYICSAATPPGVGVHGMCGYNAARRALRRELK